MYDNGLGDPEATIVTCTYRCRYALAMDIEREKVTGGNVITIDRARYPAITLRYELLYQR